MIGRRYAIPRGAGGHHLKVAHEGCVHRGTVAERLKLGEQFAWCEPALAVRSTLMDKAYTNRLIDETSPYLLQHAHNPVDWYPWGEQALTRAREEDIPILVSIGYSACHWCHVMEHESFEDVNTAQVMNELFVCIKVDREERPDLEIGRAHV